MSAATEDAGYDMGFQRVHRVNEKQSFKLVYCRLNHSSPAFCCEKSG